MKICFVFIAFNPFCTYIFVCVVIKAHILSLNNKLKKKIGLGSSSSYIFFSPGVAVNGAHSGGESSKIQVSNYKIPLHKVNIWKGRCLENNFHT
jgi:hypothetical protein